MKGRMSKTSFPVPEKMSCCARSDFIVGTESSVGRKLRVCNSR